MTDAEPRQSTRCCSTSEGCSPTRRSRPCAPWAADMGAPIDDVIEIVFGSYDDDTDHPWHRCERGELDLDTTRQSIRDAGSRARPRDRPVRDAQVHVERRRSAHLGDRSHASPAAPRATARRSSPTTSRVPRVLATDGAARRALRRGRSTRARSGCASPIGASTSWRCESSAGSTRRGRCSSTTIRATSRRRRRLGMHGILVETDPSRRAGRARSPAARGCSPF